MVKHFSFDLSFIKGVKLASLLETSFKYAKSIIEKTAMSSEESDYFVAATFDEKKYVVHYQVIAYTSNNPYLCQLSKPVEKEISKFLAHTIASSMINHQRFHVYHFSNYSQKPETVKKLYEIPFEELTLGQFILQIIFRKEINQAVVVIQNQLGQSSFDAYHFDKEWNLYVAHVG